MTIALTPRGEPLPPPPLNVLTFAYEFGAKLLGDDWFDFEFSVDLCLSPLPYLLEDGARVDVDGRTTQFVLIYTADADVLFPDAYEFPFSLVTPSPLDGFARQEGAFADCQARTYEDTYRVVSNAVWIALRRTLVPAWKHYKKNGGYFKGLDIS